MVRSAREILATLDGRGMLEETPFMPEMVKYVGRRFRVYKRAEVVCEFTGPTRSRRMRNTVLLDELRCDGEAHGGCQAGCRLFWKEAWLRPVSAGEAEPPADDDEAGGRLSAFTSANTRPREAPTEGGEHFTCQATQVLAASTELSETEPGQYVREIRSGNVGPWRFARVAVRAVTGRVGRKLGLSGAFPMRLAGDGRVDGEKLDLVPGDLVEVRSAEEIGRTLDATGKHRGLQFSAEMAVECGKRYRVQRRVQRLIDEGTGRLIELKNDCIVLENVVCTGARGCWFCPREHYPLWREAWLRRVDPPAGEGSTASS